MAWRASLNRLPTFMALGAREVVVQSTICSLCSLTEETSDQIFSACGWSLEVWNNISSWCKIGPIYAFSTFLDGSDTWKRLINGIMLISMWSIWKARNHKVHENVLAAPESIVGEIKVVSILWIGNRANKINAEWGSQSDFSFIISL